MSNEHRTGIKRLLWGTGRPGDGLDATWFAVGVVIFTVAGVGGLIKGIWAAGVFLIPAAVMVALTRRRIRERNW